MKIELTEEQWKAIRYSLKYTLDGLASEISDHASRHQFTLAITYAEIAERVNSVLPNVEIELEPTEKVADKEER